MAKATLSLNGITIPALHHLESLQTSNKNKETTILIWFDSKIDSRYDAQDARNQLKQGYKSYVFFILN